MTWKERITACATQAEWLATRAQDVSSTEAATLFNLSPYQTPFELFHCKRDKTLVDFGDNERMKWGRRLQDAIAHGIAEDSGWKILRDGDLCYAKHPSVVGMGTSFDYIVEDPARGTGILEIKNVDFLQFRDGWTVAGDDSEAPPHIELQLQHQLEVMGLEWGCIGTFIGGNRPFRVMRDRDREVGAAIVQRIKALWRDIHDNRQPRPDFTADAAFIGRLYGYAEPGKVLETAAMDDESRVHLERLISAYQEAGKAKKSWADAQDAAQAEIRTVIGDHERITHPAWTLTAPMVAPTTVSYERKGYRSFRVTAKRNPTK